MEVYILKKFDKRNVGDKTDISESIAEPLIYKGIVGLEPPKEIEEKKEVKQIKKVKNEKNS